MLKFKIWLLDMFIQREADNKTFNRSPACLSSVLATSSQLQDPGVIVKLVMNLILVKQTIFFSAYH